MAQYGQACRPGPGRLHLAIFQPEQHGSGWRTHMTMLRKILAITLPRFGNRSCKPPHRCLISQAQIDRVDGNVAVAHGVSQSNDELRDRSVIAELGGVDPLRVSWICPHWPDRSLVVLYRVSQRRTLH